MSKSTGNVIDPGNLVEKLAQQAGASVETAVDAVRYFVLREVAFGLDGDFSHAALVQRFNSDLANDLGNLLSRTLTMLQRYCRGTVPQPAQTGTTANTLAEAAAKLVPDLEPLMNELAFHRALARLWEYVRLVNRYVDEQAPWALARHPARRQQLDTVLYNQVESLRLGALLLFPFMPHTAASIWRQLGVQEDIATQHLGTAMVWGGTRPGTQIQPGEQLFPRINAERSAIKAAPRAEVVNAQPQEDAAVTVSFEEFQKLDLRVGRIVAAEPVPKAHKLLKLTVDIGQEQRTVVAGVAATYRPEALVGKSIILVANLAPRTLRGVESQGMILAAESDGQIVLASFDAPVHPGSKVQ
jgi:methionyl-tRNA synthetase